MLIYKILRAQEWASFKETSESRGSSDDIRDGFIHFSSEEQLAGTLEKHFQHETGLWLLAVETGPLGEALKWEPSRGQALFPHFFGILKKEHILWAKPIQQDNEILSTLRDANEPL